VVCVGVGYCGCWVTVRVGLLCVLGGVLWVFFVLVGVVFKYGGRIG